MYNFLHVQFIQLYMKLFTMYNDNLQSQLL